MHPARWALWLYRRSGRPNRGPEDVFLPRASVSQWPFIIFDFHISSRHPSLTDACLILSDGNGAGPAGGLSPSSKWRSKRICWNGRERNGRGRTRFPSGSCLLACFLACLLMTTTTTVEGIEEGKARTKERIETAKVVCFLVLFVESGVQRFRSWPAGPFLLTRFTAGLVSSVGVHTTCCRHCDAHNSWTVCWLD